MPEFRPCSRAAWLYIICGVAVLGGSYLLSAHGVLSLLAAIPGILLLLGGVVVLLRRRDYRALRSQYGGPESLGGSDKP